MKQYVRYVSLSQRPEWWLIFSGVGLVATVTCGITFSLATRGLTDTTLRTMAERPFTSRPWTAAVLGLLIGLVFVALCVIVLRKTRSHQVDSLILRAPGKSRWHTFSRRLLFGVPLIGGLFTALLVAYLLRVSVICAGWAAYIPIGLLYWEQKRIYEEAKTKLVADTETKRITRYVEKVPWLARPLICLLSSALSLVMSLLFAMACFRLMRHFPESVRTMLRGTGFYSLFGQPLTAIGVGFLNGLAFTALQVLVLREASSFCAEFCILRLRERLRWPMLWRTYLYGLPTFACIVTACALSLWLKISLLCLAGGSLVPFGLLYWEQKKIYEAAKAKLAALKEGTT